ncbi:MAG: acyltransferase family protein [Legionellaceae bacterium]|nr:acyltransferase family protein [Legionellaceae bacterium]
MTVHLPHPKYRPDIDGLRAIAVLSVVAFHAFPNWVKGGFIGVDVFFVISGYLISTIIFENLDKGTFSFMEFYSRRIRRIFPALLLVLAVSYVLGWFTLLSDEYKQLGKHIAGGAGFISNFILWNESGYFDNVAETKPLLHLWSLGVEEQFYILFPVLLYVAWKRKFNLLSITLIIAITSFYLMGVKKDPIATFYSPQTRFWELMSGSLLAWVMLHKKEANSKFKMWLDKFLTLAIFRDERDFDSKTLKNVASFVGLLLLAYGFLRIGKDLIFPGKWALIPVLGSVLVISAGQSSWFNKKILSNKVLVWIGLISFPLYLWHWVLLSFARIMESDIPARNIRILIVIASFALAWVTYLVIEKPFRFGGRNKPKVFTLVLMMGLIGSLGYYTDKKNGLPSRESIKQFEIMKQQFSFSKDIGRPTDAKIMLLGDSHAAHYVPGLKKYFGSNVADYTASGCIPFFNVDRYDSRSVQGACAKSMNTALESFEKNNQMTGIILASMGPVYLSGETFNGMDTARVTGDGVKLINNPKITDRWDVYAYGMRNTLERLSRANKKILFILDVPELGFDPRSCLDSRPVVLTSKKREPCAVSREKYESRTKKYKTMVHSILKDFPNVMVYDPVEDMCDNKQCWGMKNEKILYRDIDHLSNEGSVFLVEKMRAFVEKL